MQRQIKDKNLWVARVTKRVLLLCLLCPVCLPISARTITDQAFWGNVEQEHATLNSPQMNLNVQKADVRGLLQLLADQQGISVLISDEVAGTLSMNLVDVSVSDAWVLVLGAAGLAERQHRGIRYVAPAHAIAAQEEASLTSAQTIAQKVTQLVPLETRVVRVRYARAKQLLGHLTAAKSVLSPRGDALVDERLNAMVIRDVPAQMDSIAQLIRQLDSPLNQVAIEARIVTASDTLNNQLGIQWRVDHDAERNNTELKDPAEKATTTAATAIATTKNTATVIATTSLGVGAPASTLALGILRNSTTIDAELSLLAEQGQARVLAKPKILTVDQSPASIQSGVQIPYQETSRSGATSTAFREAVLSLHVLPQITPDRNIMMQLKVKQDSVGQIFNGVPSINTNEIETRVLVGNGETLVLGGILQEDENNAERKTPILGDLPIVGRLFRRKISRKDQQELLVFITPTLVPPKEPDR